ncbi:MAG TPA: hypothetical protein VFA05_02500 [Gaiellaceae bacterium]|nr:hypothetical protein [Gaiellaceae bacterium]
MWLLAGLFAFAFGIVCLYESRLGLSPWDVLNQGISKHSPLSFGTANIAVGCTILATTIMLGTRIGPGTVANAILVGTFVDLLLRVRAMTQLARTDAPVRLLLLAAGIAVIGAATAIYVGAGFGAGPRDSLMLSLTRVSGVRVGVVRAALEAAATLSGFLLGGTVGIGTVVFVLAVGPAVEASFTLLARSPFSASQ